MNLDTKSNGQLLLQSFCCRKKVVSRFCTEVFVSVSQKYERTFCWFFWGEKVSTTLKVMTLKLYGVKE